ncbi:MAG: Clp protease [Hyperionvirus sp.]|uniref:Clp protease n=1 Tax=Hyperionvirus sp. TaxID=2487770 RepID=A0A3G5ABK8_9VIRU|nr:MAG: Clp protease [Hyperionvirus sp.]
MNRKVYLVVGILLIFPVLFCVGGAKEAPAPDKKGGAVRLKEDNFVVIRGHINGPSATKVIEEMWEHQNDEELYVYISSPGGFVSSGMEIVRMMQSLTENGVKVKCIADTALSMGFVIFQYCPVRLVMPSSILMQHQLSMNLRGPINHVVSYLQFVKSMEEIIDSYQAKRLELTVPDFLTKIGYDWWLYGENAIKNKAADSVANVICDFEKGYVDEVYQTIFGEITVTYLNCPLANYPVKISFGEDEMNVDVDKIVSEWARQNNTGGIDYSWYRG